MPVKYNLISNLSALLLIALVLVFPGMLASAAPETAIRFDPAISGLKPGDEMNLNLVVEGVQDLYGLEAHFTFDPAVIEVIAIDTSTPDKPLVAGDWLAGGFVAQNLVDNTKGRVDFAATMLNPAEPVSGNYSILTFRIKGKQNGNTTLKIDQVLLSSREGGEIASKWYNGIISVSASGKTPNQITQGNPIIDGNWLIYVAAGAVLAFVLAVVVLILVLRKKRA